MVARYDSVNEAVQEAMDNGGTRELMRMLSDDPETQMRRSLALRSQNYAVSGGVHLPGEQLVAAGSK